MKARSRIHSIVTRSRFLHLEDALEIGKVRFFAGAYKKGQGASTLAFHYLNLDDARVLFADLAWGKRVKFYDYKGTVNHGEPQSRVLIIKSKADDVWVEVKNGPGQIIGQGAIKPIGDPTAAVSVPLTIWSARRLAFAALAYIRAWENDHLLAFALPGPISPDIPDAIPSTTQTPPPPDVFPSPSEAIVWGWLAGRFSDLPEAIAAYDALKEEKDPANAYEMRALWVSHCYMRNSANVV